VPYEAIHVAINDEVIASRTAREVLTVCERHWSGFNPINIITAIHRIAKHSDVSEVQGEPMFLPLVHAFVAPLRQATPTDP